MSIKHTNDKEFLALIDEAFDRITPLGHINELLRLMDEEKDFERFINFCKESVGPLQQIAVVESLHDV